MTIQTFIEKYYLHDSLITKITHNETSVNIEVEFCYWQQENYKEGDSEVGMIEISFSDISFFDSGSLSGEIDYYSILEAKIDADILEFLNQSDESSATLIRWLICEKIKRINKINTFI